MATSKFVNPHQRRVLAKPDGSPPRQPPEEPPQRALEGPTTGPKPASDRMTEVTVKLPQRLLDKLDRLVKRKSGELGKAGRSTVLRWLLDQYRD